jgi:hypothetical protein
MRRILKWPVELRENLPLVATTLLWALSWAIVSRLFHLPKVTNLGATAYILQLSGFFVKNLLPLMFLLIPLSHVLGGGTARELFTLEFWRALARRYTARRVLGGFWLVFICVPFFYGAYRDWKTAVPAIVPFWADPMFEAMEGWLHGGRQPWELLQGFLGHPMRTQIIDNLYIFWFQVQFGVVLWMSLTLRRFLRARFFITYILMYLLLGHLVATLFSSVGPPYYGRVIEGPDPFQPLLAYLQSLNDTGALYAVDIQARLWGGYAGTYDGPISGIAAFPSLHVGAATLFFLVAWSVHRGLGVLFFAFLLVTMVGWVHLAWHYALDGYVSIVAVCLLWYWSDALARRYLRWAGVDAMRDPGAPDDLCGVNGSEPESDERPEGKHDLLGVGGGA